MLFMCRGQARPGLSAEDRQKVVQIFRGFTPPAGMEIQGHWVDTSGGDYVIVEASSAETLDTNTSFGPPGNAGAAGCPSQWAAANCARK